MADKNHQLSFIVTVASHHPVNTATNAIDGKGTLYSTTHESDALLMYRTDAGTISTMEDQVQNWLIVMHNADKEKRGAAFLQELGIVVKLFFEAFLNLTEDLEENKQSTPLKMYITTEKLMLFAVVTEVADGFVAEACFGMRKWAKTLDQYYEEHLSLLEPKH